MSAGDNGSNNRRRFLQKAIKGLAFCGLVLSPFFPGLRAVWPRTKRIILTKDTPRESLIQKNPAELDARHLEVTPLESFGTMGPTDHKVDLESWRLEVDGAVVTPLRLTYAQIQELPVIERKVLLICPGVFANHGKWKGFSIGTLLQRAGVKEDVTYVDIRGLKGPYEKVMRSPIKDVLSEKVFLAYGVNGKVLPRKHGFPLRAVAEDYYGYDWVKYVYRITAT